MGRINDLVGKIDPLQLGGLAGVGATSLGSTAIAAIDYGMRDTSKLDSHKKQEQVSRSLQTGTFVGFTGLYATMAAHPVIQEEAEGLGKGARSLLKEFSESQGSSGPVMNDLSKKVTGATKLQQKAINASASPISKFGKKIADTALKFGNTDRAMGRGIMGAGIGMMAGTAGTSLLSNDAGHYERAGAVLGGMAGGAALGFVAGAKYTKPLKNIWGKSRTPKKTSTQT